MSGLEQTPLLDATASQIKQVLGPTGSMNVWDIMNGGWGVLVANGSMPYLDLKQTPLCSADRIATGIAAGIWVAREIVRLHEPDISDVEHLVNFWANPNPCEVIGLRVAEDIRRSQSDFYRVLGKPVRTLLHKIYSNTYSNASLHKSLDLGLFNAGSIVGVEMVLEAKNLWDSGVRIASDDTADSGAAQLVDEVESFLRSLGDPGPG